MEVVKEVDLSEYEITEELDTGDGLRITIYEKEGEDSVLNLDWDEGSKWEYLDGDDVAAAINTMLGEVLGQEEAREVMEEVVIVPHQEWEELVEKTSEIKRDHPGACGDGDPGK